ncbi:MAG: NAD(P)/FAD-dependent oxidoreductase, partial [Desulfobacteraceae bacterium]
MKFDVIIIGAGPAGIFAALELARLGVDRVLILEQGKELKARRRSEPGDVLSGWGGAGAFSDGKLTLSPEVGGFLGEILDPEALHRALETADELYVAHGAPGDVFGESSPALEDLANRARLADLKLIPSRIRHIGTENCPEVLEGFRKSVSDRVEVRTGTRVESILTRGGRATGVRLDSGEVLGAEFVIAAPGRIGASWMKQQAEAVGLDTRASPVDIGVRVELPAAVLKELTDLTYEFKVVYYSRTFDDRVRTFCMNPYGEVVTERH